MLSIKPDHWIRRMAQEHGMIEPFVERQVRAGVVSFGLSSYGYDIRVADEFRIFTPATGQLTVVDPKNIDERAMAPYQGEVCIVPPNSFALARTIEYFRIPRNVLTICLGKSTYARCFRGDTRVALVDGTAPTLEEMAVRAAAGESFWGYSLGPFGRVMVTLLEAPRYIGRDALLEVELDNGAAIRCTPDHGFLLRDGRMTIADDLRPGDSLMPLYRHLVRGYEMVYQPSNGHLYPTHRLADEWNLRHELYADEPGSHRHHIDFDRRNNQPLFRSVFRRFPEVLADFRGRGQRNHRIAAIRELPGDHDVFCLTVPEAGNFALEAGVFTSNCGIIVNVTPFEPEWEGHVTIEISNTTPLPAKIYANEGIAQVLFFEGEPPEVSYADRAGKYQGQRGITLPRL
jgi:dCTP deaminase